MTAPLLRDAGLAIYGPRWHAAVARALNVAPRTVYRWESGQNPVPTGVYADLLKLATDRGLEIDEMIGRLRAATDSPHSAG